MIFESSGYRNNIFLALLLAMLATVNIHQTIEAISVIKRKRSIALNPKKIGNPIVRLTVSALAITSTLTLFYLCFLENNEDLGRICMHIWMVTFFFSIYPSDHLCRRCHCFHHHSCAHWLLHRHLVRAYVHRVCTLDGSVLAFNCIPTGSLKGKETTANGN